MSEKAKGKQKNAENRRQEKRRNRKIEKNHTANDVNVNIIYGTSILTGTILIQTIFLVLEPAK